MLPSVSPIPTACVESKERCQCCIQDGTRLTVAWSMCHNIMVNGFFVDFDTGKSSGSSDRLADRGPDGEKPAAGAVSTEARPSEVVAASGPIPQHGLPRGSEAVRRAGFSGVVK